MADTEYKWTDNPTESGKAICDTDVLNECLMHLKYNAGASREVGEFVRGFWSANHVPKNLLYCDGAEFSGAEGQMFRNMWTDYILTGKLDTCSYSEYETELTMTGSCYKWAVDTANEKFKIPFVPDRVLVDIADILPVNMTGFDTSNLKMTVSHNGYGGNMNFVVTETGVSSGSHLDFEVNTMDAKTYKTIRHYVVVATGSINQSEADWSEFASSLQSKANTDLLNTKPNASFRRDSVRWGIPDYEQIVEIDVVSGGTTTYAAAYDGIVWGKQISGTAVKTVKINGHEVFSHKTSSGTISNGFFFPVYQGDIVIVENVTTTADNNYLYFAPYRE